jgi:uncharacterized protein (DUF4415 family)
MEEYDYSKAKKDPAGYQKGKSRITIYLDREILDEFRRRSQQWGKGYQTMINDALREYLGKSHQPLDEAALRRIIREELNSAKIES